MSKRKDLADVAVTVVSDGEPVQCVGQYSESGDGFVLEFVLGLDGFKIEHTPECTRVVADGQMSYSIDIRDTKTQTLLATPYGNVRFTVTPLVRNVVLTDAALSVELKYLLSSDAGDIERAVEVHASF